MRERLYDLALLMFISLLSACVAPPQYKTEYQLIPPQSANGQACIQQCEQRVQACEQQFTQQVQQCAVQAAQQAKQEMPGRLAQWEQSIAVWEQYARRYERDLDFYEIKRRHRRLMRDSYYDNCRRDNSEDDDNERDCWRSPLFYDDDWLDRPRSPGPPPKRPTLERVTAQIQKKNCSLKNDCNERFRQCFAACGGTVTPYKVCVGGNCPPA